MSSPRRTGEVSRGPNGRILSLPSSRRVLDTLARTWFNFLMNTSTCQCGCEAPVRRSFLPGHDAKLKGALIRTARDGGWRESSAAVDALISRGWARFIPTAALEAHQVRLPNGQVKLDLRNLSMMFTDSDGRSHGHMFCSAASSACVGHANDPALNGWICATCVSVLSAQEQAALQVHGQAALTSPSMEFTFEDLALWDELDAFSPLPLDANA